MSETLVTITLNSQRLWRKPPLVVMILKTWVKKAVIKIRSRLVIAIAMSLPARLQVIVSYYNAPINEVLHFIRSVGLIKRQSKGETQYITYGRGAGAWSLHVWPTPYTLIHTLFRGVTVNSTQNEIPAPHFVLTVLRRRFHYGRGGGEW
jgi:hypothetical protein